MKIFLSIGLLAFGFPLTALACDPAMLTTIPDTLEIQSIYPNPLQGETEWIELYNNGTETLDLAHYTLADNTEKPWGMSGSLAQGESLQISGFPFQLNNGGDTVFLSDINGTLLGQLEYSSSTAGQSISPGNLEEEVALAEEESPLTTPSLWPEFSEALPNPEGSDTTEEWIELYNPHAETLNLKGLYLDDQEGGSSPHALEGEMAPESFLFVSIEDSGITLNNSTDHIRLLGENDEVLWDIVYDASKEGEAYAFLGDHYDWTNQVTPNAPNLASDDSEEEASDFQNGDLSEDLSITEVLPNPEGPDAEGEWIEITNGGSEAVNLGNWTLDDGPGGSDPYVFPDDTIIEAGDTLLIDRSVSGLALNNSEERVELIDFTGEVMDEVSYSESVEGQSYAEITIEEVETQQASLESLGRKQFSSWKWVLPSPGERNPTWIQVIGEVQLFEAQRLEIFDGLSTWDFQVPNEALNTLLFQKGNRILVQGSQKGELYWLMNTELLQSAVHSNRKPLPWGFILMIPSLAIWVAYEFYKKKRASNALHPTLK